MVGTSSFEIVFLAITCVGLESVPRTSAPTIMEDIVRGNLVFILVILVILMEVVPGDEINPRSMSQRRAGFLSRSYSCSRC